MSSPGSSTPLVINGGANAYDRAVAFDAPVEMDTGRFADPNRLTLAELRAKMMTRMGYAAQVASPPPGLTDELNSYLQDAQEQLHVDFPDLRTERWWAWQLTPGNRYYDVPIDGVAFLDVRKVTWAGIADNGGRALQRYAQSTALALGVFVMATDDTDFDYEVTVAGTTAASEPAWPKVVGATVTSGTVTFTCRARPTATWYPLVEGIDPLLYSRPNAGMPTHFDLRDVIEVFPVPDQPYVLWLKGFLGVGRFTSDGDYCTIDGQLVFLHALAMAKSHRGQGDADKYQALAQRRLRGLIAGSHGRRRYIPRPSTGGLKHDPLRAAVVLAEPKATFR